MVNMHPTLFYAPHCSRQEKVPWCTRNITSHRTRHIQITPQVTPARETVNRTKKGGSESRPESPHTPQRHADTQEDAYSMPHPVPPKITPRARTVPATAPMSLLVAMFTVWREKRRFKKKKKTRENHTLVSLSYKTISLGNALSVSKVWLSSLRSLKFREYMKIIFIVHLYVFYFKIHSLTNTFRLVRNPL